MNIWGLNSAVFDRVNGAIIMKSFPPISNYKGIEILSSNDIAKNFDFREKKYS
jgi:hypothetical protein